MLRIKNPRLPHFMIISRKNNKLIIELDLFQTSYDAIGEEIGQVPNLIGIIAGDKYTISHLNDLGYKDSIQEGMPIIYFDSEEDLRDACKTGNIDIWKHPLCVACEKPIRGSHTMNDKGSICWECKNKVE